MRNISDGRRPGYSQDRLQLSSRVDSEQPLLAYLTLTTLRTADLHKCRRTRSALQAKTRQLEVAHNNYHQTEHHQSRETFM